MCRDCRGDVRMHGRHVMLWDSRLTSRRRRRMPHVWIVRHARLRMMRGRIPGIGSGIIG